MSRDDVLFVEFAIDDLGSKVMQLRDSGRSALDSEWLRVVDEASTKRSG